MRWIDNPIEVGYKVHHDHYAELQWRIDELQEDLCPAENSGIDSSALSDNLYLDKNYNYYADLWSNKDIVEDPHNTIFYEDNWDSHEQNRDSQEDLGYYSSNNPSHDYFFNTSYDDAVLDSEYGNRDVSFREVDDSAQYTSENPANNTDHRDNHFDPYDVGVNNPHNYPHSPSAEIVHRDLYYEGWYEQADTPDYDNQCSSVHTTVYSTAYEYHFWNL